MITRSRVRFDGGSLLLTAAANPAPSGTACTATTGKESGGGENGDSRRFVQTFDGAILSFGSALRVPNVADRVFLRGGDDVDDGALVRADVDGRGLPVGRDAGGAEECLSG